jgi:hypothetical protein
MHFKRRLNMREEIAEKITTMFMQINRDEPKQVLDAIINAYNMGYCDGYTKLIFEKISKDKIGLLKIW